MSRDDAYGNRPAWIATLTGPMLLLLFCMHRQLWGPGVAESLAGFTALPLVPEPILAELTGLLAGAILAAVVGPHLAFAAALALFAVLPIALHSGGMAGPASDWFFTALYSHGLATGLASIGVSTGGGAPGLRYASMFFAWAGWLAAPQLTRLLVSVPYASQLSSGVMVLAALVAFLVGVLWWTTKRHPRPAAADATFRVAGITGLAVAIIAAVHAADALRSVPIAMHEQTLFVGPTAYLTHLGAATTAAVGLGLLAVLLQVLGSPSRLGLFTGAGCLLASLAALWSWTAEGEGLWAIGLVAGVSHAMLLPWVWARATSDVHWRIATAFAGIVLFAPHLVDEMTTLWAVAALTTLAFAAIPVGSLGWFGDDWVYGDVPGSSLERRGRR